MTMARQDDTALVAAVEEAVREVILSQGLRWPDIARAAIAAVREHDRVVVSTEEASRRLAAVAVRSIATKGRDA